MDAQPRQQQFRYLENLGQEQQNNNTVIRLLLRRCSHYNFRDRHEQVTNCKRILHNCCCFHKRSGLRRSALHQEIKTVNETWKSRAIENFSQVQEWKQHPSVLTAGTVDGQEKPR